MRNRIATDPGLVEEKRVTERSFAVQYAKNNDTMKAICKQILAKDKENINEKRTEWKERCQQVADLLDELKEMDPCPTFEGKKICSASLCDRCKKHVEIEHIKIEEYEHLLPEQEFERLAIAFELHIPRPIACLRDILYGFAQLFGGNVESTSFRTWSNRPDICEFKTATNADQSVKLGYTTRYDVRKIQVDQNMPSDKLIIANASNCVFHADQKPMPAPITNETTIKTVCMPFKLKDEYTCLQWTLNGTTHTENEVLVQQSKCPEILSISEYKNFGSLRADGHRLQLRKLSAMIETEGLSFDKESVLSLIMQTLWECGIKADDDDSTRESHYDFLDQEFCKAILQRLDTYTMRQENNWMHPFKLFMVVLIAVRIFEINNDAHSAPLIGEVMDLLLKIRIIVFDWIDRIERAIRDMQTPDEECERQLRLKLIYVTIIGGLTFFVSPKHQHFKMIHQQRNADHKTAPQQWLRFVIILKSNMQVYARNEVQLPSNLLMFLRLMERIGVDLEATMRQSILRNRNQIHDLVRLQWQLSNYADFKSTEFHQEFQHILTVAVIIDNLRHIVTIDIITGVFLVDGALEIYFLLFFYYFNKYTFVTYSLRFAFVTFAIEYP